MALVAHAECAEAMNTAQQIQNLPSQNRQLQQLTSQSIVPSTYISQYREYLRLRGYEARLIQQSILLERQAIHGRTVGTASYIAQRLGQTGTAQAAGRLVQRTAENGYGMAMRGFNGTVEMNRLQTEIQMISRELAGALKPAIDITVQALKQFRQFLEGMSPAMQNRVALGIGAVAANSVSKSLLGIGLGGLAYKTARYGYNTVAGSGAAVAAGTAGGINGTSAAAAGASRSLGARALGLGGRLLGRVVVPVGLAMSAYDAATSGDYGHYRGKGDSQAYAGLKSILHGLTMGIFRGDRGGGQLVTDGPNAERRRVTIADAGFQQAGGSYERMTTSLALRDAQDNGADTRDIMQKIYDFMLVTFGDESKYSPPPMRP
jgi:hypothetical protein